MPRMFGLNGRVLVSKDRCELSGIGQGYKNKIAKNTGPNKTNGA